MTKTTNCIVETTTTVWYAPTARKRYLTKRAAIRAEALARIKTKHEDYKAEYDDTGNMVFSGWNWTMIPRHEILFRRMYRLVQKQLNKGKSNVH
jgi:hypothetical protein